MPAFESRGPRKRGGVWWDVLKLVLDKPFVGWLAGPAVGVDCHYVERSRKACRRVMSDDALSCPYCDSGLSPRFTGYVPLWGQDCRRWLCIMGDRHWPAIESVPHLTTVIANKTHSRGQAIYCGRAVKPLPLPDLAPADRRPADITGVLLTMWGDEVLRDWCLSREVQTVADAPAAPAKPPKRKMPKATPAAAPPAAQVPADVDPMYAAAHRRADGLYENLVRAAAASTAPPPNGTHPPRKPK